MPKFYVVCCNDKVPGVYVANYFPRKFRYKAEEVKCAKDCVFHGACHVRVECPNGEELDYRPTK